jgi:ubiquinol-cytochrome c reductase cytochrome b subunit
MIARFTDWLESRTGAMSALKDFLEEDVPGGASYWYVFGSATLIILIIQIVTGILLTFYYAPSSATAWESTKFIYDQVPLGKFIIGVHYWGASVMIILVTIHLLQVTIWGAYKKPREIMWVVGVLMFVLTLVLGLTGYLLPWDLNAYFASQVSINIAGSAPFAGQWVQNFLQDGPTMGTLTINRFFGLHVWLVPIVLLLLVGSHLYIFRHNGAAGPTEAEAAKKKIGRFFPDQIYMDTIVSVIAFIVVVVLAIAAPPELEPKAQPSLSQFQPSPAWYFMPLYGMLRMVSAAHMSENMLSFLDVLVSIVLPTLFVLLLLLLPWIDRNPSRSWHRRPWLLTITAIFAIGTVGIGYKAYHDIEPGLAANDALIKQIEAGQIPGVAPAGAQQVSTTGGVVNPGASIFSQNCASCHGANGQGTPGTFPPLAGNPFVTGDAGKVIKVVRDGLSGKIVVNGQAYNQQMPAWKSILSPKQLADVITYIRSSWGNRAGPVAEAQVRSAK